MPRHAVRNPGTALAPVAPELLGLATQPGLGEGRDGRTSDARVAREPEHALQVLEPEAAREAASLDIHLHCLVLDGVDRRTEGEPIFDEARHHRR